MEVKELSDFIDRTLTKGRYPALNYSIRERVFAQTLKISEEVWELSEQISWKFWWQRLDKVDKFSDEKLGDELADVILTTVRLARLLNIDMDKILKQKIEILRERFEKEN